MSTTTLANHVVTATFGIDRWDEAPTWEDGSRRITRATVVKRYEGALQATGTMEYVMAYAEEARRGMSGWNGWRARSTAARVPS